MTVTTTRRLLRKQLQGLYDAERYWILNQCIHVDQGLLPGTEEGDCAEAFRQEKAAEVREQINAIKTELGRAAEEEAPDHSCQAAVVMTSADIRHLRRELRRLKAEDRRWRYSSRYPIDPNEFARAWAAHQAADPCRRSPHCRSQRGGESVIDLTTSRGQLATQVNRWLAEHADEPLVEPHGLHAKVSEALASTVKRPPWNADTLVARAAEELLDLLHGDESPERGAVIMCSLGVADGALLDGRFLDANEMQSALHQVLLQWLRSAPGGPTWAAHDLYGGDLDNDLRRTEWRS